MDETEFAALVGEDGVYEGEDDRCPWSFWPEDAERAGLSMREMFILLSRIWATETERHITVSYTHHDGDESCDYLVKDQASDGTVDWWFLDISENMGVNSLENHDEESGFQALGQALRDNSTLHPVVHDSVALARFKEALDLVTPTPTTPWIVGTLDGGIFESAGGEGNVALGWVDMGHAKDTSPSEYDGHYDTDTVPPAMQQLIDELLKEARS